MRRQRCNLCPHGPLDRDLWVGHTLHLVHDTPEGCIVRSRFWLGEIDPMPKPISREEMMRLVLTNESSACISTRAKR